MGLRRGARRDGTGWWYGGGPGSEVRIGSLAGMPTSEAATALQQQGLVVGGSRSGWDDQHPAGTVSATVPSIGSAVQPGTSVVLVESKGAQPAVVPVVKGQSRAAATARTSAARLRLGDDLLHASKREAGTVLRLVDAGGDPLKPGASLPTGTVVRLVVSTGPAAEDLPVGG